MKKLPLMIFMMAAFALSSQAHEKAKALPHNMYTTMVSSITSADIVLLLGGGGSLGIDKDNIGILKDFIENTPSAKIDAPEAAVISCQLNGNEYLTGKIYLGDEEGAVVFTVDGKEYINLFNQKGTKFLRSLILNQ